MPGKPVVRCLAKHNSPEAKKGSDEDAEGMQKEILLVERAKIMIPCNVWTSNYFSNSFTLISWACVSKWDFGCMGIPAGASGLDSKLEHKQFSAATLKTAVLFSGPPWHH
ncbi:hypothetical protein DFH08DRAFT_815015 [Mycena albidolilacea]|uniref:Uncharacterized protein n=1 Tax=Mycena albidolilacea TaxID=1033008 RepID=A0AAD6ZNI1_9AGAR|nr:hypothetical protein DFH08DRAFT_815015 [Mycena albidolilacea]